MNEQIMNTQAQAQSYLDKAETYRKLGLKAQVQHELDQARKVDPYVVQEVRYKTLLEDVAAEVQKVEGLRTPLRIGAGMVFVNALVGAFFLIIILSSGGGPNLTGGDFVAPIVNVIIGVNLWQIKKQWQKYTGTGHIWRRRACHSRFFHSYHPDRLQWIVDITTRRYAN
jgi:hypothetical protein